MVPGNGDLCCSGVGNCAAGRAGGAEPRQALFAGLFCYSLLLGFSGENVLIFESVFISFKCQLRPMSLQWGKGKMFWVDAGSAD